MTFYRLRVPAFAAAACIASAAQREGQDRLNIVTTLPTFAVIAEEIAGDRAEVVALARGDQDAHFVTPRPSFAARLQRADLFVATAVDLVPHLDVLPALGLVDVQRS